MSERPGRCAPANLPDTVCTRAGDALEEDVNAFKRSGVHEVVAKPVRAADLVQRVNEAACERGLVSAWAAQLQQE